MDALRIRRSAQDLQLLPIYTASKSRRSLRRQAALLRLVQFVLALVLAFVSLRRWLALSGRSAGSMAAVAVALAPARPPALAPPPAFFKPKPLRFLRSVARPDRVEEPACEGFRPFVSADGGWEEEAFRPPLNRDSCFVLVQVPESAEGYGLCVCSANLLFLNYVLLNEALLSGELGGEEMSCSRLCREEWRRLECPRRADPPFPPSPEVPDAPPIGTLYATWTSFENAFRDSGGLEVVLPPGARGYGGQPDVDWVARGESMPDADVLKARNQWKDYMGRIPEYPGELFGGRGIVTTGGGLKYMVPTIVSIYMIRHVGCMLPIEVWFFANEMPDEASAAELRRMGVIVRNIDEMRLDASRGVFKYGSRGFGFVMKAAVILFSSFEELIYLDSDNVALHDLAQLFDFPAYRETGMVLWPDYWSPTSAPDLFLIAPEAAAFNGTTESGQMLINKRSTWRALMLAMFLNCQGALYYNLLTNYMGMGDKETFPMAMRMLRMPYHQVGDSFPLGSIGLRGSPRKAGGLPVLLSTTMVQYHPATGLPLLLHSNLNKWTLNTATRWEGYERRWQVITPPGWRFSSHHDEDPPLLDLRDGARLSVRFDPEKVAWTYLTSLHCSGWLESYLALVGNPGQIERVFDARRTPYDSFLLDEHMTGQFKHVARVGEQQAQHRARAKAQGQDAELNAAVQEAVEAAEAGRVLLLAP